MPTPRLVPDDLAVLAGLMDRPLHKQVSGRLAETWPFTNPDHAPR